MTRLPIILVAALVPLLVEEGRLDHLLGKTV